MFDDTFYLQNYKKDVGCITRFPKTDLSLTLEDGCVIITNKGNVAAVGVFIERPENDTRLIAERNFLLIEADEERRIAVSHTNGLRIRALNFH